MYLILGRKRAHLDHRVRNVLYFQIVANAARMPFLLYQIDLVQTAYKD